VSGSDVPKATKVMAVISSGIVKQQPSRPARSAMNAVTTPIIISEAQKHSQPSQKSTGGMKANRTFQKTVPWFLSLFISIHQKCISELILPIGVADLCLVPITDQSGHELVGAVVHFGAGLDYDRQDVTSITTICLFIKAATSLGI